LYTKRSSLDLYIQTYRALAKKRLPKRIIWGTFPAFPGTSTEGAILDGWGPLHLMVRLGKHRVTPGIDASL